MPGREDGEAVGAAATLGRMQVEPGQQWEHLPSSDFVEVVDVVPYEVASGGHPRREGIDAEWVARCIHLPQRLRSRRDSSDMDLVKTPRGFEPRSPSEWRLVEAPCSGFCLACDSKLVGEFPGKCRKPGCGGNMQPEHMQPVVRGKPPQSVGRG